MKRFTRILLLAVMSIILTCCISNSKNEPLSVLVISGGHNYDTAEFELMFKAMPGISPDFALKPDAWEFLGEKSEYDVLVFYDMYQEISAEAKEIFLREFEKGTGMVFLHHSLGSHQDWPEYADLLGGKFYIDKYTDDSSKVLGYTHDINLKVNIIDRMHSVTKNMENYEVIDEGYTNVELRSGISYLLETDHPLCDRYIGWEHKVRNSRVVYLMGGHDRLAFENESFSRIVENAVRWVAETDK